MNKILKKLAFMLIVCVVSIALASVAMAAPPDHARGANKGTPPGLLDKGGLPPGMHGRTLDQLPPGIRYNSNFQEAIERLKEEEKSDKEPGLYIFGSEYIFIPDESEDAHSEQYKAVLVDEDGYEEEVNATWSLSNGQDGVSISGDGVLEVTPAAAEDNTVTIEAGYTTDVDGEEVSFSAALVVTLYKPAATSIEIVGEKYVALQEDEGEPLLLEYTAIVMDQNNQAMPGKEVTWSIDNQKLDFDDGTVTIAYLPAENDELIFTLTAEYENGTSIIAELEVVVYHPVATAIEVKGATEITLPDEGETATEEYEAVVVDQYGQAMDITITMVVLEAVTGVSLENGTLTITDEAEAGSFLLSFYYEELAESFEVTLVADEG